MGGKRFVVGDEVAKQVCSTGKECVSVIILRYNVGNIISGFGFWNDDAQVVLEIVGKAWSDVPTGICIEILEIDKEG